MMPEQFLTEINNIFDNYPKDEWLDRCLDTFTEDYDIDAAIAMIEIENGGDVEVVDDQ